MTQRIYLDNNGTTPLDPRVLEAMLPLFTDQFGNPSSLHSYGQQARKRLTQARHSIAAYLKVKPAEIIFTSSGTEALNMVIRGIMDAHPKGHVITSSVEHSAVFSTAKLLEKQGCEATFLSPGLWGAVTPEAVKAALKANTRLIVLMAVNNETGVKTDIAAIAKIAQEANIPFVVDGVALLGREEFIIPPGVSAMCFSGHKLHAPKGVGFAFARSGLKLVPLIAGGDQEFGKRSGTENMAGIVGLEKAIALLGEELLAATKRMADLRDLLEQSLQQRLPGVVVNGVGPRICNTTNLSFEGVDGELLLAHLDQAGIAVSHGSACASGALEPSRILLNMGVTSKVARTSFRFSLSRFTTQDDIERCVDVVTALVQKHRGK